MALVNKKISDLPDGGAAQLTDLLLVSRADVSVSIPVSSFGLGDVTGPVASVVGNIPTFLNDTGDLLADSGANITAGKLTLTIGAGSGKLPAAAADVFVIDSDETNGLSILTPDALNSNIYFGSPANNRSALVRWNSNSLSMSVGTIVVGGEVNIVSGNNVTAIHVDADQKVGIGIALPLSTLHVATSLVGVAVPASSADDFVVEVNAAGGMTILTADTTNANLYFGSPANTRGCQLRWNFTTALMDIGTVVAGGQLALSTAINGEAIRIDANQNVGVGITAPIGKLHIANGSSGATPSGTVDELVVEGNSANVGINVLGSDVSSVRIRMGNVADPQSTEMAWLSTTDTMILGTSKAGAILNIRSSNAITAIAIDADQDIGIGTANPSVRLHVEDDVNNVVKLQANNSGSAIGPTLNSYRNSDTPDDQDAGGGITFNFNTSDGAGGVTTLEVNFCQIRSIIVKALDGDHAGEIRFHTAIAGGSANRMAIAQGLYMRNAVGGDQGIDTINASQYFADGNAGATGSTGSLTIVGGIVTVIA